MASAVRICSRLDAAYAGALFDERARAAPSFQPSGIESLGYPSWE